MEKLTTYNKNGYGFSLLYRENDIAIFSGVGKQCGDKTWEIVLIQSHNGKSIKDTFIPPKEFPPSNNQWGSKGWTAVSEEDAWRIFREKNKL